MNPSDEHYMQLCIALAEIALKRNDPPVGALLVWNDQVIGEGIESAKSTGNITHHAEINAINDAIAKGFKAQLSAATLYTTHEPCIMCSYAIRHYQIPRVVYGVAVKHVGGHTSELSVLTTQTVPKWKEGPHITGGICEEACKQLSNRYEKQNQ